MATWHTPNGFLVDQNVRDQHYNMALYRAEIYRMWGARDDDESRAQFSEAVAAAADAGWIEDENTLPKRVAESSSYSQVYAGWKCINNFPVALTLTTGRMEGLTLYMREFEYYTDYGEYGEISLPDC